MKEPVILPESCLVAIDKAGPGVWRCIHGHMHLDVKTALEARGFEPTQENMDALTEKLKETIPDFIPGVGVTKARIE